MSPLAERGSLDEFQSEKKPLAGFSTNSNIAEHNMIWTVSSIALYGGKHQY